MWWNGDRSIHKIRSIIYSHHQHHPLNSTSDHSSSNLYLGLITALLFSLVTALRPQTPNHIRGGWPQYTDTNEPVDGGVGSLQLWTPRATLSVNLCLGWVWNAAEEPTAGHLWPEDARSEDSLAELGAGQPLSRSRQHDLHGTQQPWTSQGNIYLL
jgi:hypothetical protein